MMFMPSRCTRREAGRVKLRKKTVEEERKDWLVKRGDPGCGSQPSISASPGRIRMKRRSL